MAELVILTEDDIPDVMRIERLDGYDDLVGRFTDEEHRAQFASPDARYLGWRDGAKLAGFTILQEFRQPTIYLRRIAVAEPGRGTGSALLYAVLDWIFAKTPAKAVRLHVRSGNERARRVYERAGFTPYEAVDTGHRMSVPRTRWVEKRETR
jgi:RimJ/RimL family protein N-acetyltransferase